MCHDYLEAIQVLHNDRIMWLGGGHIFQEKAYESKSLKVKNEGGWGSNLQGKRRYVTLEWLFFRVFSTQDEI